jgi:hypothetical protein
MKTLVATCKKLANGPLLAERPKRPAKSLALTTDCSTGTSGMSSSESPVVKKSAGDKNSFDLIGSSVTSAGSSAFKGMVSRMSDGTTTGIVTLRAATSAMLVAWGASSGNAIVVAKLTSEVLDTTLALKLACGRANAMLKSMVEMTGLFILGKLSGSR